MAPEQSFGVRFPWVPRAPSTAQTVACVAVGLQLIHAVCLFSFPHPLAASNLIQLILPALVVAGCFLNRSRCRDARDRRTWMLFASAFGLWTVAEIAYLIECRYPNRGGVFSSTDDVLWLLFAVPLLLVVSGSLEGKLNWISWLDQGQAFIFFVVVAVLVYSRPSVLSFDMAYSIQNFALLLSCSLRYSAAETEKERSLFARLAIYLVVYFLFAGVGNALAHWGWAPGSAIDLFWTLPLSFFSVFVLTVKQNSTPETNEKRLAGAELTRYLHDLSALGLAALSMGSSVYLALHWTLPGAVCLAFSFVGFSIRTCGRERELHRTNERLHGSVLEDALTGLGNRTCLRENLDRLLKSKNPNLNGIHTVAVLFVDLDRFKVINDGLGHETGDKVLVEVARRIKLSCQGGGVPCRLSGDEFVVLLQGKMAEGAERLAATILADIRTPLQLGHKVLQLSGSIGVAITRGEDEPDDLLRKADHAMYRAKRLGKNRVEVCDNSLFSGPDSGYMLEADLRECLEREQIGVYLQPIYSLQSNDVCGFEALARWSHPKLGMVDPGEFIPLAEETGMILNLGIQVLTRACRALVRWNATWNKRLSLSVNISARQFSDPNLLPSILEVLANTRMDPQLLHLEVTESVLLVGEDTVAKVLLEAQRHGMSISLDDFGTGYSSLSHLLSFPTDEIKIDRSFVRGLHQDARRAELVRTVLHLGHSLQKRVVAEGVETQEELEALQAMGCRYVQGHFFSKPFPAESLPDQPLWAGGTCFTASMPVHVC